MRTDFNSHAPRASFVRPTANGESSEEEEEEDGVESGSRNSEWIEKWAR